MTSGCLRPFASQALKVFGTTTDSEEECETGYLADLKVSVQAVLLTFILSWNWWRAAAAVVRITLLRAVWD